MREIKKVAACSCYIDGGYKFSMRKWNGAAISQSITRGTGDVPLLKRTHWYKVNNLDFIKYFEANTTVKNRVGLRERSRI